MKYPKNQHDLVFRYLLMFDKFSLKDVIDDSMFFKFQTRLGELEKIHGTLATRKRIKFKNRFGHDSSYVQYKAIDKLIIRKIYGNS
jgi:hypothetical protein